MSCAVHRLTNLLGCLLNFAWCWLLFFVGCGIRLAHNKKRVSQQNEKKIKLFFLYYSEGRYKTKEYLAYKALEIR